MMFDHTIFQILTVILCYVCLVYGSKIGNYGKNFKLAIDQDAGADDAMAIYLGIIREKYFDGPEIVAITTTHGNVDEPQAFINTQRILSVAERQNIPIYRGSNNSLTINNPSDHYFGVDGLGDNDYGVNYQYMRPKPEHAAIGLIQLSKKYEGELIVLTLGALTNIALAIRLDPLFISRLAHLYVAAGHIQSETRPDPEFNVLADVEAYYATVRSANPDILTLIPLSQSPQINKTWRTGTLGRLNTKLVEAINAFESLSLSYGKTSWTPLDPWAMALVIDNTLITESKYTNNTVGLCGSSRGLTTNEFLTKEEANGIIVYSSSEDAYKEFLMESFSKQYV